MRVMDALLRERLSAKTYASAEEYARVLHSGVVEDWVADLVLSFLDPPAFERRLQELKGRHV